MTNENHGSCQDIIRSSDDSGNECETITVLTVDEAIDSIGTGRFQYLALFAAGTCFMADSMEIMLLSFLTIVLKKEWNLDADNEDGTQSATISSILFLGALVGTSILGPLGDKIGRKPILSASTFLISVFGLATAACRNYLSLLALRFMVGFGVGGITVPFDILVELLPTNTRGKSLLLIDLFWSFGSMLVPVVAYFTLELADSWRVFVIVCTIPCIISFVCGILFVPESPRWLLLQGRESEALDILRRAASMNGIDPLLVFPEGCTLEDESMPESSNYMDLFSKRWRERTLVVFSVCFGLSFCYYGTIGVVTEIFENGTDNGSNRNDEVHFDYSAIFISSSAEVLGLVLLISTIDTFGRVPPQVVFYAAGGICLFLFCYRANTEDRYVLVGLAFMTRMFETAASCVTWISTTEIFSTEIRSTGHSAANAVAKLGGFLYPYLVSSNAPIKLVGGVMLFIHLCTSINASRIPETKGVALGKAKFLKNL